MLEVLAERVLESTADALALAELDSRRRKGQAGNPEDTGKRNRRKRDLEGKRTRSFVPQVKKWAAYSSTDEDLEREDESKVRRIAGTKPGALLHSGLMMMHRHLGRQVEVCESVDAVQAKGIAAAYLSTALKPNAGSRLGFRNIRELQSSAEAVDLLMRGRVASAGDVVIQRFRAVEASALEEGGWSLARHLELLPDAGVSTVSSVQSRARLSPIEQKPEDTESQRKAPGGRTVPDPPSLEEWSRRTEQPRADRQRIREEGKMRGNGVPSGPGTKKPSPKRERRDQRKTKEIAEPVEEARLTVCGAGRASISDLNKKLPPNSVHMGRSRGPQ